MLLGVTSLVSILLCLFKLGEIDDAFQWIIMLPILYFPVVMLLYYNAKKKHFDGMITLFVYIALQWIRCVLFPGMGALSGYFRISGMLYTNERTAMTATLLSVYELIVTGAVWLLIIMNSRPKPKIEGRQYRLCGNYQVYILYSLFTLVLYFWRFRGGYTFFALSLTGGRTRNQEVSVALSSMISYGMLLAAVVIVYFAYKRYEETRNIKYYWIALLTALIKIGIIPSASESRMAILYDIVAFLIILPSLFPDKKKNIVQIVVAFGVVMIVLMSVYKFFRAFFYSSYLDAIQRGANRFDLYQYTGLVNSYFYCVPNISRNLYISEQMPLGYKNMLWDVVDNVFGFKYLLPSGTETTISMYNMYIYSGEARAGHLYSSISHGVQYLGLILSPLATTINICVAIKAEQVMKRIRSVDVLYISAVIFSRIAYNMFACFTMSLNYCSRTIIIGGVVIGGASLISRHINTRKYYTPIKKTPQNEFINNKI